ncbi:hypothetical protein AAIA72_13050 [Hahella sp. SMD15-11]|uniref:Uncharacterized protein n=2 Tax=Thermohahella caldifontis TaxID=3142973 RepID=A0AB39UTY5_9GAMM
MSPEMKATLLKRKFSSIEYMEEMERLWNQSVAALEKCIDWFYTHNKDLDLSSWQYADTPMAWEDRVLPNFRMISEGIREGIEEYQKGDPGYIRSIANNIMALSKDMDVMGDLWFDYIPKDLAYTVGIPKSQARQMAKNIYYTVGEYWRPGEITDEEVTGPIDEQDLLRYLRPGESPD